jgi:ABC-type sugar transport system ATPase subunit
MEVRFEGVRHTRRGRLVLDVPALVVREAVVTAVMGANGSGKTTMLRLVAGLERPTAGAVTLGGRVVAGVAGTRDRVAYSFQAPVFLRGTVRQNLELALRLHGVAAADRNLRITETATACGIADVLERDVRHLSGGEAQRANLARALVLRAPVMLLDEPLSGLDRQAREQLLRDLPPLLARFASTVILVTHEREEALRLGNDLVILAAGRVQASGSKRQLFAHPPGPEVAAVLGYQLIQTDRELVGVAPDSLVCGAGECEFEMRVERVTDLGGHFEAYGSTGHSTVVARVRGNPPAAGENVVVSVPRASLVRFRETATEPLH